MYLRAMTLRPFPAESDFGRWDVLPADPTEDEIDHENPAVVVSAAGRRRAPARGTPRPDRAHASSTQHHLRRRKVIFDSRRRDR
ncbi:hypothetical protein CEP50_16615 [Actinopolyspora mortivallis]|uniref:Uncharacterized protein n=1 Tax=Actinopolyspora mortivallis TaxID=33906 RepID=A0A2T0GSY4_ACTMO|nr:hypothetical protein CEP50_16615 [Actinopolyspora mortivallis]